MFPSLFALCVCACTWGGMSAEQMWRLSEEERKVKKVKKDEEEGIEKEKEK